MFVSSGSGEMVPPAANPSEHLVSISSHSAKMKVRKRVRKSVREKSSDKVKKKSGKSELGKSVLNLRWWRFYRAGELVIWRRLIFSSEDRIAANP